MNDETTQDFLAYEELKIQEKEIKSKLEILKEKLTPHVSADAKVNCKNGVIELKKRDNWKYSEATEKMAQDLKETQKAEIAKGEAVSTPTYYMEYRQA